MKHKPHFLFQGIRNETQARRFLDKWREFLSSEKADASAVLQKLGELRKYDRLDVYPFYLACVRHNSPVIRLGGLDAIESLALRSFEKRYVDKLRDVLRRDQDPTVRGSAARALGYLAGTYKIPQILNLLLRLVTDNSKTKSERLGAYQGLLYLTGKIFEPGFEPWKIKPDDLVEGQIDWKWLAELKSVGSQNYRQRSMDTYFEYGKRHRMSKAAIKQNLQKKQLKGKRNSR